ncbi:MAG: hypothetical protein D6742_06955, partial [Cyanobacteria bacterium J069]
HLVQCLQTRLPELSDHHWRPRQEPLAIIPDDLRYQLILPGKESLPSLPPLYAPEVPPTKNRDLPDSDSQTSQESPSWQSFHSPKPQPERAELLASRDTPPPPPDLYPDAYKERPVAPAPVAVAPPPPPPPNRTPIVASDPSEERSWRQLVRWGGGLLSLLMVAVIARNVGTVLRSPSDAEQTIAVQPSPGSVASAPLGSNPVPNPVSNSIMTPTPPPTLPQPPATNPVANPAANSLSVPAQPVAPDTRPVAPASPVALASDRDIMNAAMATLTKVRAESSSNQVSEISEAIRLLRQIRPDQPLHKEAQQTIDRWSQLILDMAAGRAMQRNGGDLWLAANNYRSAIAAAQLVPSDRPNTYSAAQQAIANWSQQILNLANIHAQSGAFSQAVQVAQLVPPRTPSYEAAQSAIATWQTQIVPAANPASSDLPLAF